MTIWKWLRGGVCLGCSLTGLAFAPRAQARGLAGSTEVQLKTAVFEYDVTKNTAKVANARPGIAEPVLTPSKYSRSSFGLMGSGYGAEVGYFVTEHLQFGAGLQLTHGHSSNDAVGSTTSNNTSLSLVPRIDYVLSGAAVRPYFAGFGGYQHSWYSSTGPSFDSKGDSSGYVFGGAIGAHVFLGDSWSLDPELAILRDAQSGTQSTSGTSDSGSVFFDYDDTSRATAVMLSVGLSGWLGGR